MATKLKGTGVEYTTGRESSQTRAVIKHRMVGATTVDQGLPSGGWDYINGTEISMGTPASAQAWYRCEWYTDTDDQGGSNGGSGYALYRWTPSSGWNRILDSGWHANYDANAGDFYTSVRTLYYAPALNNTEEHRFRIYGRRHPSVGMRCNCSIGADLRQQNWNNALFEVWELDANKGQTTNMTRY